MSRKSRRRRQRERIQKAAAARAQATASRRQQERSRPSGARQGGPQIASDRHWHVLRTLPRWADRTCVALNKLDAVAFLPRWSEIRVRRNRRVVHHSPILARTIFVGVRDEEHLREACGTYGVLEAVRFNGRLAEISADEMRRFAFSLAKGEVEEPVGVKVGDRVLVLDGPFASFPGVVEEIVPEGIRVAVSIFGRATPVTLGLAQVDRLNS